MTSRRRTLTAVLVVVLVATAAVGGGAVVQRLRHRHGSGPSSAQRAEIDALIPGLEAFVEATRGLKFLQPVHVQVVGDDEFTRLYDAGGSTTDAVDTRVEDGVLNALGLLDSGGGRSGGGRSGGGSDGSDADSAAGFYDSDTKALVVRGTRATPFVRQVLVHELTHALDDQHFGINPDIADDDAGLAFDALTEGDATVVENRYVDSLSPAEQQQSRDEAGPPIGTVAPGDDPPDVFTELDDFPYADGPALIDAVLKAGGQARLDAAFRAPPSSSAEVLHPERYLAGKRPVAVPAPSPDGGARVVDDAPLGEFMLRLLLEETVPDADAERAAAGWAGDHYVAWRVGRRYCVRDTVVLDSPTDSTELLDALRAWGADHRGATVESPAALTVTLTRCA